MATLLLLGVFFLDHLLKLVQFLAQLHERLPCGFGFHSTFLSDAEIGFFCSVFLEPMAISSIVCRVCAPMLLAKVAVFLDMSFLWSPTLVVDSVPGRVIPFFSLCKAFLLVETFDLSWLHIHAQ